MTYLVNGKEFSTKKDATEAVFKAAEKGEVVVAKAPVEGEPVAAPAVTGMGDGVPVEL